MLLPLHVVATDTEIICGSVVLAVCCVLWYAVGRLFYFCWHEIEKGRRLR
jgi:hypothetical protein